jgi:hypothetical protein
MTARSASAPSRPEAKLERGRAHVPDQLEARHDRRRGHHRRVDRCAAVVLHRRRRMAGGDGTIFRIAAFE